jgi:hypothetical protein
MRIETERRSVMRKLLLVAAVVALTAAPPLVESAMAKGRSETAPNGERGTAIAAAHNAGSEGAGKVNVQDISFIFSSGTGEPPGKQIGGGGGE